MQKVLYPVFTLLVTLCVSVTACRKPPSAEASGAKGTAGEAQASEPQAPPKPLPAQLPEVLARVNGEPVKKGDFDRLVKNIELGRGPIPAERRDEILRGALDQLVTYTVMTQEAKSRNVAVNDIEVEGRLKQMRGQFPNEQEFQKALAARGMSLEQLKIDAKLDMMIDRMLEAEVAGAGTDAEAREYYEKNPDTFKQGEAVRASHILIMADQNATEDVKKKARATIEGLLKRVKGGEDFAKVAKEHSQDGSAQQGGDLGFFDRGRMVPEFSDAAFAMKPGQISDIVTTQFGYHIIKVTDRRPASAIPFEQVSPRIVEYLKQQRANAFIQEAKKRAKIEVLV